MQKWIPVLTGLLLAQLVLALAVFSVGGEEHGAFEAHEKLLAFDPDAVDGLRIDDGTQQVVLAKRDGQWRLPESGDFPASSGSVERLLDKLAGLQKGWPVATTAGAARRFKVSDEEFERKLTLLSGEQTVAELYLGTSPGFRKVHVRPADEDAVFDVALNSWEANAKTDDWIDKGILQLDASDVERVEMPDFVLQRENGQWQMVDLAEGEQTNAKQAQTLLSKLVGLRIESLVGSDAPRDFRQDQPELEVTLTRKDGSVLTYQFFKPEEGAYYVVKRSDRDQYFRVAEFTVKPIQEMAREKLVQAEGEADSVAAPGGDRHAAATTEPAG